METIKKMNDCELKQFLQREIDNIKRFCPQHLITLAAVKELISNASFYSFVTMRTQEDIVKMIKELA